MKAANSSRKRRLAIHGVTLSRKRLWTDCTLACQMQLCYLAPMAISPLGRMQQRQTDWAGRRMVWEHSPCLHILKVLSSPVLTKSTGESKPEVRVSQPPPYSRRINGCCFNKWPNTSGWLCTHYKSPIQSFHRPLNININEQTLAIGEDSQAVDVVGVAVIDLNTFACHQPPSDTRVIAARDKLSVADHC